MAEIGFVGLGRMGFQMARHLNDAGHRVVGVDPVDDARSRAAEAGVEVSERLADLAGMNVVMSSLPNTEHVEEVYGSLIPMLGAGTVCADLSTISVDGSRRVASMASDRRIAFCDAPVSGTSIHAEAGTLAIMLGGAESAVEVLRPLLATFSTAVHHLGVNGAGLEMKLITNRLLTTHLVAIGEAILAMEDAGLDVEACIELLRAGAVPRLLDYKAGPLAARDFTPLFTVGLMSKDLRLADERRPAGRVTGEAAAVMLEADAAGLGPHDIAAIMEII